MVEYLYQGGIERLLQQIAAHTPPDTASLAFFAYQTPRVEGIAKELQASGVPLYTYDKAKGYDLKLLARLIEVVKKEKIDTLHTHDFGPMEYAVALKLRFPKLQLVHTHHSLHYFFSIPKYPYFFQLFSLVYSRIICVSEHVREELAARCPLSRRKLLTVYNGVDLGAFSASAPVDSSLLRLVSICRISPEKNLIHLLKACRRLKKEGIAFELHHAGSGDPQEEKKLKAYVKRERLEAEIHFYGFQSDVRETLARGDIFVSTSVTEGHPVAVLEAMAASKICLCSDIRPHRLVSEEAIRFFSLEDDSLFLLLKQIARDREAYAPFADRAREEVSRRFSIDQMIANYAAMYQV